MPSHGNPIVMMADHQTTGGYTKIANVISVDLPKLAQCMPGTRIRFKKVGIEEAQALYCEWRAEVRALSKRFAAQTEPVGELQAAALAAALNEHKHSWSSEGVYRVVVNGEEFVIELSKETARFR